MGRRPRAVKRVSFGMTCSCGRFKVNELLPDGTVRNLAFCPSCDGPLVLKDPRCNAWVKGEVLNWED